MIGTFPDRVWTIGRGMADVPNGVANRVGKLALTITELKSIPK